MSRIEGVVTKLIALIAIEWWRRVGWLATRTVGLNDSPHSEVELQQPLLSGVNGCRHLPEA